MKNELDKKKYDELFNNALFGITVHDSEGKIVEANNTAEKIFGISKEELSKKEVEFFIGKLFKSNEEPMKLSEFPISLVWKNKAPSEKKIIGLKMSPEEEIRWFLHSARPLINKKGDIERILTSFVDVTNEKKAEEKLIKKDVTLKKAQEITNLGIWEWDIKNDEFKISEELYDLFNIPKKTLIKFDKEWIRKYVHSEDIKKVESKINDLFSNHHEGRLEFRIIMPKTKEIKWINASCPEVIEKDNEDNPTRVIGTVQEITEIKESKRELKDSEEHLKSIFNTTKDAILVFDEEGKIINANPAAHKIYDYSEEEMIGLYGKDIVHKNYYPIFEDFREKCSKGEFFRSESLDVKKDGTPFYIEVNGSCFTIKGKRHLLAIVRDISKRKKYEEEILNSRNKYKEMIEMCPDGIITVNNRGFITSCNKTFYRITGYSKNEILGRHFTRIPTLSKNSKINMKFFISILKSRLKSPVEYEWYHKDGSKRVGRAYIRKIKDKGKVKGLQIIARDITKSKKYEEKLKVTNKQLRDLDRAKSNLLNMFSHKLKTPLTAIKAHLEVLNELKSKLGKDELESIDAIRRNSYILENLIKNILEISRFETNKLELNKAEININEVIDEVIEQLKVISDKKGLKMIVKKSDLPDIMADETRVKEIIDNLISNSIKFTDKGNITIKTEREGEYIKITIKDTGIGIPKNKIKKIFNKFYRVNSLKSRKNEGTGLGLSITKQLIEMHEGIINVNSKLGEGSTFSFNLPITKKGDNKNEKNIR